QAIAAELQARGHRVFGTSRRASATAPSGCSLVTLDVDDEASVTAAVAAVQRQAGRIDALVNNAGFGLAGAIEDTSVEEARRQFETNFFGMHRMCRAVLPQLRAQRCGRIVNLSSLGGLVSVPFQAMYCASKFAVEAYTEALRMEVRPFGIHVAMVEPGDFATRFTANRLMTAAASAPHSPYAERCATAVRRMGEDESSNPDVAPVVRAVVKAVEAARPRLRYPAANAQQRTLVALRPLLPQRLFEYLVMDNYRIR
ncbi:MAG: SDR family oxidoreductase, partial [Gammaproteobacteria bacterium]|nr:SDR family oxidoreductase [Gammaproteobacteria bacterium]MDH5274232.1 SDR family oxidoreductase [Gammaproteobacteria bacterium]